MQEMPFQKTFYYFPPEELDFNSQNHLLNFYLSGWNVFAHFMVLY
jgi:hypothetical protein